MDVARQADWIVDVGPAAGEHGGEVLYSGPVEGLAEVERSVTRRYLFPDAAIRGRSGRRASRRPGCGSATSPATTCDDLEVEFPLGC